MTFKDKIREAAEKFKRKNSHMRVDTACFIAGATSSVVQESEMAFGDWMVKNVTYNKDGFESEYISDSKKYKYFLHTGKWRGHYHLKQLHDLFQKEREQSHD